MMRESRLLGRAGCRCLQTMWRGARSSAASVDLTLSTGASRRITEPVAMTREQLQTTYGEPSQLTRDRTHQKKDTLYPSSAEKWIPHKQSKVPKFRRKTVKMPSVEVQGEVLYGKFPVLMALKAERREVYKLYIKETMFHSAGSPGIMAELVAYCKQRKIAVEAVSQNFLSGLVLDPVQGLRQHQGICADVSPKPYMDFVDLDDRESDSNRPKLWLLVQSVQDPNNFGAVLRTAHYLGLDKIIAHNSCKLSPAVSKVSAGALELIDVYQVINLPDFLQACRSADWQILGTASMREPSDSTVNLQEVSVHKDTVVVLGNEGSGLRKETSNLCDQLIIVGRDQQRTEPGNMLLDSLNVSVATGIILHDLSNKRNSLDS